MGKVTEIKKYPRVLTIAGSDSGGGAGIQADLKTIFANGCYGMSVITALTAQNTVGVSGVLPVEVDFVKKQLEAVLTDIGADAIKIGMLFSPEMIKMVAGELKRYELSQVVLDPVMVAQSGDKLLQDEAIAAMREELLPLVTLLTPNLPEASLLLGREITLLAEMPLAGVDLIALGPKNVLIKGGHLESELSDDLLVLADQEKPVSLPGKRIPTRNNHGTGCTLSSAIASGLAKGLVMEAAVRSGKEYITGAIHSGAKFKIGHGHGPVDHYFAFRG